MQAEFYKVDADPFLDRRAGMQFVTNDIRFIGALSPLMDDVRANNLASAEITRGKIYLKAVASPYTGKNGIHLLLIPDHDNHENIPGVTDLSVHDLTTFFTLASTALEQMTLIGKYKEAELSVNHLANPNQSPKKGVASFPVNLHGHLAVYSAEDLHALDINLIKKDSDIRAKTYDPTTRLCQEIYSHEVIKQLKLTHSEFSNIFKVSKSQNGFVELLLKDSKHFSTEAFAAIIQDIDRLSKVSYREVAQCFVDNDWELIPKSERLAKIKQYITDRPWLSKGSKCGLLLLASEIKSRDEILTRELANAAESKGQELDESETKDVTEKTANRFFIYRDFAYSMTWKYAPKSGKWIFIFAPKIFNPEGAIQSKKIIFRDINTTMTKEVLDEIQTREQQVIQCLVNERELGLQEGPGIALKV